METFFTDEEYRILLSALSREEKICKIIDENAKARNSENDTIRLLPIVRSLKRKLQEINYNKK